MTDFSERLERAPQELQVSLNDTYDVAEVGTFWSKLGDAKEALQEAKAFMNVDLRAGDKFKKIEKVCLDLKEDIRLRTDQVDLIERGTGAALAALDPAKEVQNHAVDDSR